MTSLLREQAADFVDATDEEKLAMMKDIRKMAQTKMGDFMQGMRTDEARRYSDGYFDMDDDERDEYDSIRDKFRDFFGSDDFTQEGWSGRGRRGGDSDSDSDGGRGRGSDSDSDGGRGRGRRGDSDSDSDEDVESIVEKIRDFLGGSGSGSLGKMLGGGNG